MNTLTICRKELNSYFRSPIAYGVMAFFALIAGYFFYVAVLIFVRRGTESMMMGQNFPMDVGEWVIRPVFSNISVIGLFLIPMITMRLFAEEKRSGTIELLMTSPLRDLEIILGKWMAALILYAAMLGLSLLSMALLFMYGSPDWKPMMVGYLGLLLQGGALLAIGTFISTWTKNQIVAGVAGFAICLLLWVLSWVSEFSNCGPGWFCLSSIISYLSVLSHFDSFQKGVIDTKDLVFYLSAIFVGLFLTARSLESLRWRS
jgi:ABC-2 type transport system permease protein